MAGCAACVAPVFDLPAPLCGSLVVRLPVDRSFTSPQASSQLYTVHSPMPQQPDLLGVRVLVGAVAALLFLASTRVIHRSRVAYFGRVPTVEAVAGTSSASRSRLLCSFRLAVFAWQLTVIASHVIQRACIQHDPQWPFMFAFFTIWNYLLQTTWWALASMASLAAIWSLGGPASRLRLIVHVLLSVCVPAAILVSVVLWCVLLPVDAMHVPSLAHRELNAFSYNMHAINTLCLLVECALNRMLLHPAALPLLICWACLYMATCWLQQAYTGFWPYFFMSTASWSAVGWYALLILLHVASFGLVALGSRLKARHRPLLDMRHYEDPECERVGGGGGLAAMKDEIRETRGPELDSLPRSPSECSLGEPDSVV